MISASFQGLLQVFDPNSLIFMLIGVFIGLFVGFIPGLGGHFILAMLIPFVMGMDLGPAVALLLGTHAVVCTGGSISAILFNTPGTGANAATLLDGYPLTKQGKAGYALGAALTASAIGGVVGALVMVGLLPVMRTIILSFGPPEFFILVIIGIGFIALLGEGSIITGIVAGGLGIFLSLVGMDPATGIPRFTFGQLYLWEGIKLIPLVIGLFALAEMINLGVTGGTIAEKQSQKELSSDSGDVLSGIVATLRHWWLVVRTSILGAVIGLIPGLGADVATFMGYGHAVQSSKDPQKFGKGAIEGVIAPEAANNSKEGGALLTTVGFGIPGSSSMAILIGAFMIIGIVPGKEMVLERTDQLYGMAWTIAIANVIAVIIVLMGARYLAKLTFIRGELLVPIVIAIAITGASTATHHVGDIITVIIFGIVGFMMRKLKFSRAALLLGFVLGALAEKNLFLSLQLYGWEFLLRPIVLVLSGIFIISFLIPFIKKFKSKRVEGTS